MACNAIETLARRFPQHASTIPRLQARDPNFRSICEDYGLALRALEHWQMTASSSPRKVEEYRLIVKELEAEALTALEAFEGD
jgi:hypothetical protein